VKVDPDLTGPLPAALAATAAAMTVLTSGEPVTAGVGGTVAVHGASGATTATSSAGSVLSPASPPRVEVPARPHEVPPSAVTPAHVEENAVRILGVARLLHRGDGGPSTMTLHLQPAHLGRVRLDLQSVEGDLVVRLAAEHRAGAEVISAALGSLRTALEADGLRVGDVTVSTGSLGSGDAGSGAAADQAGHGGAEAGSGRPTDQAPPDRRAVPGRAATGPVSRLRSVDAPSGGVDLDL
jgi:flagellar hook-length control protein FliK